MKASMIASLFSVAAAVDLTWTDCGDASTHTKVTDLQPTHLDIGATTTLVGSGTLDADQTGGTFNFVAKTGPIPVLKGSGNLCEDTTINFPLGAGSIKFHSLDCPVSAGDLSLTLDVEVLSQSESNDLLDISLTATSDNGDKLLCMDIKGSNLGAQDEPTRPHLAQAWSAKSSGDGLPGEIGQEHYLFTDKESHHLWDYGAEGSKLWSCHGAYNCVAYYLKLNGPNCCKCADMGEPKQWDIPAKDGLFSKTGFTGFEDTTELNDNPITGAEHWTSFNRVPMLNVTYDYFLHREDNGDVISHRIDFGASEGTKGSILYGEFQVAHDLDEHRKRFDVPEQCKGNILDCCDNVDELDQKYDFHSYFLRQVSREYSTVSV